MWRRPGSGAGFGRSGKKRAPARHAPRRRLPFAWSHRAAFELLEERAMLAVISDGGTPTLTIELNNAGETLGIVSNGASYSLTTNNAFVDGGVAAAGDFAAFGAANIDLLAAGLARYSTIQIIDSAAGTSVTFNNSGANTYTDDFTVLLNNASAGVAFNGSSSFTLSLTLNADGTIVDSAGAALAVAGLADLAGTSITLGDLNGDTTNFGSVTFNSAGDVVIYADSEVVITGMNTAGNLDLRSGGPISDAVGTRIITTGAAGFHAGFTDSFLAGSALSLAENATDVLSIGGGGLLQRQDDHRRRRRCG